VTQRVSDGSCKMRIKKIDFIVCLDRPNPPTLMCWVLIVVVTCCLLCTQKLQPGVPSLSLRDRLVDQNEWLFPLMEDEQSDLEDRH
jgi:hypothetical protein